MLNLSIFSVRCQILVTKKLKNQQKQYRYFNIKKSQTNIKTLYNNILNQTELTTSYPYNFISNVVKKWTHDINKTALTCIDQVQNYHNDISYSDVLRHGQQIAYSLSQCGIKKGDAVALMLGQQPEWWFCLAGLMQQGIAVVPCSRLLTPNDLIYRINDLSIRGIVTTPDLQERIDTIRAKCPTMLTYMTTGTSSTGWHSLPEIFSTSVVHTQVNTTSDDPCLYLYTSGTTGQPKAVQHNHDYPFFHWPTGKKWLKATPNDCIYNASDTGWGFTVWTTLAVWSIGAKLLIMPTNKKFEPKKMLSTLCEQPVSIFCAAPTVLRLLVAENNFNQYKFPHLKRIVTIGEALDETVIQKFESQNIEVAVGYGQAETPLLIGRIDKQPHIPNTMGRSIDPYKVVILDDKFKPLPKGKIGQIALDVLKGKSNGLMRGYANDSKKTYSAFSPNGRYYLTGDWGEYRKDGLFSYQGRKDDLIKSRGYRIGPDEVEKAGMSHPAVAKIVVVGIRTSLDSLAITVKAFILLKNQYTETNVLIKDIQNHIKQETAPNKYPRLIECLDLNEWEKYETTSGKIRRAALREREESKLGDQNNRIIMGLNKI